MKGFLTDSLIIANPAISDNPKFSNIAGKAVYIVEHSEKGAIGISLNKSFSMPFDEISQKLPILANIAPDELLSNKILEGGLITNDTPWVLGRNTQPYDKQSRTEILTLNFSEQAFKDNVAEHMAICGIGTFGWGKGQLENELANRLWHHFTTSQEALLNIPFNDEFIGCIQLLLAMKYE